MKEKLQQVEKLLEMKDVAFIREERLGKHTSFKIGGPAALFVQAKHEGDIRDAAAFARQVGVPYMILGKGSNVLFPDEGFMGMIIHMEGALAEVGIEGDMLVARAGADLMDVCHAAQRAGLSGLEPLFGIPGSVGGAVYMNAGAYGGEVKDTLVSVRYLDEHGVAREASANELELGYRSSVFQRKPWAILAATFKLTPANAAEIEAAMLDYMGRRADKQPLDKPSAGSAFKRPEGAFAGALIDQCGLRGYRVGGAAISEKHCGFIVNLGGATCADVLALAEHVSKTVKAETGYELEKEVRVVWPEGMT